MSEPKKSMMKKHLESYKYAMRGILLAFQVERNMSYHLVATCAVLLVNFILKISHTEWLITLMLIGMVWTAEIFNTAIEKLADRVTQERDPIIGQVKDLAAGGVLVISVAAVICALIIYCPYIA
ncbi:MAG TPA: diacylglycerol kinase family protein [Chryseolinea sp.]|jgi:diacylglycerol kinase|nr:diacylglycerol kinase family protein [Chryseolinea sp.]